MRIRFLFLKLPKMVSLLPFLMGLVFVNARMMHGRPPNGMLNGPVMKYYEQKAIREGISIPADQWFNQTLDHFNPQDSRTFSQRYQVNDTFYQEGGPLFIMIGGEGPANGIWIAIDTAIMIYAQQFNALVVQLEHRFYGETHPLPDISDDSLQYLSSEQALADIAVFRNFILESYNFGNDAKVFTFGGSYSGALSAFFRTKYPNLANGAIATSAPVLALLDFYQYQQVVQNSLLTASQGQQCVENIASATQTISNMLASDSGRQQLMSIFQVCGDTDLTNSLDVMNFMSSLASNIDGIIQYNLDNRGFEGGPIPLNVADVCNFMTNGSNVLTQYATVNNIVLSQYGESCLDVSYQGMVQQMRNVTWGGPSDGSRQWIYQTCVEFGFYQTSDASQDSQPFGNDFGLGFSLQQCHDFFGIAGPNVNWTNTNYGGLHLGGTNIVMPNGSIDPWHALSILQQTDSITTIYINGTAHCANMYPPLPSDPVELQQARFEIMSTLEYWITH